MIPAFSDRKTQESEAFQIANERSLLPAGPEPVRVPPTSNGEGFYVTLLWFVIWLICDIIGDEEPLTFDPVNWWAGSLLFVVAVDLAGVHARSAARG